MSVIVGVTGGIGAGKSVFCGMLASEGAAVIDADRVGWELLKEDAELKKLIIERFGRTVADAGGEIDRKKLGLVVFSDTAKLAELNAIIHPRLLAAVRERVDRMAALGHPAVVVDAALIAEWKTAESFDIIVVVTASAEERAKRLRKKGMGESEIAGRINSQADDKARLAIADVVVENNGSIDDLRPEAKKVWNRIMSIAKHRRSG